MVSPTNPSEEVRSDDKTRLIELTLDPTTLHVFAYQTEPTHLNQRTSLGSARFSRVELAAQGSTDLYDWLSGYVDEKTALAILDTVAVMSWTI